ncbi:LCP family protein [Bifidobacterium platyrrhinorum]|uniref:Transcriptional regulator n=1 Tax=Bifidobacterium platyrrhinorum TaxID=2661628 RepID=A0A6L9SVY0_9BIFI|nr:LCP family protein [Bifidobacterium platyrrhinorum]NEG55702.1 transcriptional regulator [Bifidobacterium platyrrhinorum]
MSSKRSGADIPNINGWDDSSPRHSVAYRVQHRVRNTIVCAVAAVLVFAGSAAGATMLDINGTIADQAVGVIPQNGKSASTQVVDPNAGKSIELLILGQDTRDGDNTAIGGDFADVQGTHNADTTMVMQISADRKYINLVSIPRDSLVDVPSCETSNGTVGAQYGVMFNTIFASGYDQGGDLASAASCTMNAVNSLTGLNIQNFIVVDFNGLKNMIDAVNGVDLCIPSDVEDPYTNTNLSKGWQHLDGTAATQYARMRHGAGDGSDVQRTTRQQYLVKQLLNEALQKDMLTQSGQLYQLAKAALKSLNISKGLANTTTLAGLAMSLKDLKVSNFYTRTVPVVQAPTDANRVVWGDDADDLWAKMRNGEPFVEQSSSDASSDSAQSDSSSQSSGSADGQSSDGSADQSQSDGTSADGSADASQSGNTKVADGVEQDASGQYIDTATGGIIDTETGIIKDAVTGQVVGISEAYLNNVACPTK